MNQVSNPTRQINPPDALSRPAAMGARASDKIWDAIVIGAGHNGLINAAYLQRAGLNVLVVEKNPHIGGAAVSSVLHDGWTYSNCSYVCSLLRPEIMRDLDLYRHGLQVIPYEGGMTMMGNGGRFCTYYDHDVFRAEMARFSKKDADAYDHYSTAVMKMCRWIKPLLLRTPPDPTRFRPRDIGELIYLARHFSGLGERDMGELIRFFTLSIAEFLDEYFETDVIKAHFAGSGIIGTALGPYSPGTAYVLLHHYMGDIDGSVGAWGFARGGMGSVSRAVAGTFQAAGGTIMTDAPVARVLVRDRRAEGVLLTDGTVLRAKRVVSNLDVKRTFTKIVESRDLPADFLDLVSKFKIRGSSGKLNIALDGMPEFDNIAPGHPSLRGDLHFTDSMERMERAYDDWKAGRWSRDPYVDMLIPTQIDPTMAPPGKHYMSVFIQYAPPTLADGRSWDGPARDEFRETVLSQIAAQSPNFRNLINHVETRTPWDIENEVGLTEGNIFQGELTMDQLIFNRPIPGYAQYRAPIGGLYMCGSSTHPGGGVMGAPGANAAREILRDIGIKGFDPRRGARSLTEQYDSIVIGGGHNGLVCAAYLARAGQRVLVLEAAADVGGAARTETIEPGFRVSACAHLLYGLHPRVVRELELKRHGLDYAASDIATTVLSDNGAVLRLKGETVSGDVSAEDKAALPALRRRLLKMARALRPMLLMQPPRLANRDIWQTLDLAKLGLAIRGMGQADMRDFLRIATMNVFDLVQDNFNSPLLQAAFAADAVLGTNMGPRSPGTVLTLLHRLIGEVGPVQAANAIPKGGMGAVTQALASAAEHHGAKIRTEARVRRILVEDERATGVELENGDTITARSIISNADPQTTMLRLIGARHLDAGFQRDISKIRSKGNAAKLNLALSDLPRFRNLTEADLGGRILLADSASAIEAQFDPSKYGEWSPAPLMEITLPSVTNPGLVQNGGHVLSAIVQYAPYALTGGWDARKPQYLEVLLDRLESAAPGIRRLVVGQKLLTPLDLERDYGLPKGHWHHGELAIDQLMMLRPVNGAARYAMPVAGVYLCGAGCHPGGGVMGAAGHNAAQAVLATTRAKRQAA